MYNIVRQLLDIDISGSYNWESYVVYTTCVLGDCAYNRCFPCPDRFCQGLQKTLGAVYIDF